MSNNGLSLDVGFGPYTPLLAGAVIVVVLIPGAILFWLPLDLGHQALAGPEVSTGDNDLLYWIAIAVVVGYIGRKGWQAYQAPPPESERR